MILIQGASASDTAFEQTSLLAHILRDCGVDARLDASGQPSTLPARMRYEAAPLTIETHKTELSGLILVDCDKLSHAKLASLHQLRLAPDAPVIAIGAFEDQGRRMAATAQVSFATARSPLTIDLADHPMVHAAGSAIPCLGVSPVRRDWPPLMGRPAIQIFAPKIEPVSSGLQALTASRSIAPMIYTSSGEKSEWLKRFGPGAHVMSYGEVLPHRLAAMGQILVLADKVDGNYRGKTYLNSHIAAGSVIIDATQDGSYLADGLPVLRGPADLGFLGAYLRETVLPNLDGLADMTSTSTLDAQISPQTFFEGSDIIPVEAPEPPAPAPIAKGLASTWFMPTNGHGLGHAQRCTLVAEALREEGQASGFLAFPSCIGMIRDRGFDAIPLVSRSHLHRHSTANDELNYTRIASTLGPKSTFVFDGGYVFDSVTRSILEHDLSAVWIRRGLWTSAQDNTIPLDRERYFARVITPREGLEELNRPVSGGEAVRDVGPIVRLLDQKFDRTKLRKKLAKKFGAFDELIVTMLGSGVYLDISTQLQMVSSFAEKRDGCLNLIVVWPGSRTPAARFAWQRSRVVSTQNATALAAAADVTVSAAGYNSFHETLYNKIPTIFVPQVATWLDDQLARAELAADMGLAACVAPERPGRVTRELALFLDRGKGADCAASLAKLELPKPGTADAARLIAEMQP